MLHEGGLAGELKACLAGLLTAGDACCEGSGAARGPPGTPGRLSWAGAACTEGTSSVAARDMTSRRPLPSQDFCTKECISLNAPGSTRHITVTCKGMTRCQC